MPYRRKGSRKRPRKRRRSRKRGKPLSKRVAALERQTETKVVSVLNQVEIGVNTSGQIWPLFRVGEGDGEDARAGNDVLLKKGRITYFWESLGAVSAVPPMVQDEFNYVRVLVVQRKISTSAIATPAAPAWTDFLASYSFMSPPTRDPAKLRVYKIVYDKHHLIGRPPSGYPPMVTTKALGVPYNTKQTYVGVSGAENHSDKGHYWICAISDSSATYHPRFSFRSDWKFCDN